MNEKSTKSCHLALKMNVFYYAAYSIVILVFNVCTDSFWEVLCSFVIRVQPRIAGFSLQSVSSSSRKFRSIFCFFWCKNVFFRWSCRFFSLSCVFDVVVTVADVSVAWRRRPVTSKTIFLVSTVFLQISKQACHILLKSLLPFQIKLYATIVAFIGF